MRLVRPPGRRLGRLAARIRPGAAPKTAIFRHFRLGTGLSAAAAGDSAGPTAAGGGLDAWLDGGERLAGCAGQVRSRQRRCRGRILGPFFALAFSIEAPTAVLLLHFVECFMVLITLFATPRAA